MARSHRLFDLMQALRRYRRAVSGRELSRELGVSLRTIRRDIATLQDLGADIEGEAGVGYIMRPGFLLPPLTFTADELQALVIGAQWVSCQTDEALAIAVNNAMAKINAVLSPEMQKVLNEDSIYVRDQARPSVSLDFSELRKALREQRKLLITLSHDELPNDSQLIWPIMLSYIDGKHYIAAWFESDEKFHIISLENIATTQVLEERYIKNRRQLVKEWREQDIRPCNMGR